MATATNVGVSVLPEYPGVDPVEKELEEWWKATQSVLDRTDHGHYDRGEVPPRLEKDTALRDVTAIGEKLALPATTEPTYMASYVTTLGSRRSSRRTRPARRWWSTLARALQRR